MAKQEHGGAWSNIQCIHSSGHIQWNLPERPLLLSDHLTKIPIGLSVSQIAISETSRERPPKSEIKGGRLREVSLYSRWLPIRLAKTDGGTNRYLGEVVA